jgi:hypothetical protein
LFSNILCHKPARQTVSKAFILYADDTVILSESERDLQAQLDAFHKYCLIWKLKVNKPVTCLASRKVSKSFKNKENKNGDKLSPV